jgi:integrase
VAWREALRKADLAERQRAAELRALSDETRVQVEAQEDGWAVEYDRLRDEAIPSQALSRPVERLSNADLFAFRNARLQAGVKPGTINRDLRVLRAALKRVRPDYRFPPGLFFPEDDTRVRWLRTEEEALLFASIRSPFGEMAQLAALTLMRLSEIPLLRRDQVDLAQGVVVLAKAKGGPGVVMLSETARGILGEQLRRHESEWVFPAPHGRPYTRCYVDGVFRKASRAVGLRDFHFHDLRHHGATMALNANYTAPIVIALGRWKSEKMMRRYAAVTDKTLRAAAEAVSGNVQWQQGAKPAPPKVCITPCQDRALVLHKADL